MFLVQLKKLKMKLSCGVNKTYLEQVKCTNFDIVIMTSIFSVLSLIQSIKSMYETPKKIFSYGENAKKYADSELTWESFVEKLLNVINRGLK